MMILVFVNQNKKLGFTGVEFWQVKLGGVNLLKNERKV